MNGERTVGLGALDRALDPTGWRAHPAGMVPDPVPIADVDRVRELLRTAARDGRALSYSELLGLLGHRFTRPKMRALCRTLDWVDEDAGLEGDPPLAVLVVRESDGLPGQGWWTDAALRHGHAGAWEGPAAAALVRELQGRAFDWWRGR